MLMLPTFYSEIGKFSLKFKTVITKIFMDSITILLEIIITVFPTCNYNKQVHYLLLYRYFHVAKQGFRISKER